MKTSKQNFLCAFFLLLSAQVFAQANFQKYYDEASSPLDISAVASCSDGGFIVPSNDLLIKLNSAGDLVWAKRFSANCSECGYSYIQSVAEISGEGYVALGISSGMYKEILFFMKTDLNGNLTWVKYYSPPGETYSYDRSKLTVLSGGFLLTGSFWSGTQLVRTDANGDLVWGKFYQGDTLKCPGFQSVVLGSGNIITCYKDDMDLGLFGTDNNGTLQWSKRFVNNNVLYNRPYTMIQTNDGNILIAGFQSVVYPVYYGFLIKMDYSGNILWNKIYDGASHNLQFYEMKQLPNSNIIISGVKDGYHPSIIEADNNGNVIYSKYFDNSNLSVPYIYSYLKSHVIDANNIVIAGGAILFKTDASGNFACNATDNPLIVYPNDSFLTNNITSHITEFTGGTQIPGTATLVTATITATDYCSVLGIAKASHSNNELSVFPNPAVDKLMVTGYSSSEKTMVQIYNAVGEKVFQSYVSGLQQTTVDVSRLNRGVYYVKVFSGDLTLTKKVIKM